MFKDFFRKVVPTNTIETKAANMDLSNMQLVTGTELSTATLSPKELMAFNTHWVYTCNTKNAGTCSSIPLKLFYQNNNGSEILNSAKVTGKNDVVEILEHPFLDLIKNVNPNMNWTDLTSLIFGYMGLIGNSYVRIEKDGSGKPIALYPLLSENVILKMNDANGEILYYKYFDSKYKPEEIIKFSNLQPSSLVNGKGELEACIKAVQRYCYYDSAESYLNKNNMRPDFIASYKTKMTEGERNDVETVFKKHFGRKGLGKPLITSEMDIKPIGLAPKEMQWIQGREAAIKEILATFGVPEALIFLNSSNLASSRSATSHYLRYTIFPKMTKFCEKLNEQLLPLYDENLYCDFDRTVEADPTEQAIILNSYVGSGVISVNEAREKLGLEPLEEEPTEPTLPTEEDTEEEPEEEVTTTTTTMMPKKKYTKKEEDSGERWVTINGRHVQVDGEGNPVDGSSIPKPSTGDSKPSSDKPEELGVRGSVNDKTKPKIESIKKQHESLHKIGIVKESFSKQKGSVKVVEGEKISLPEGYKGDAAGGYYDPKTGEIGIALDHKNDGGGKLSLGNENSENGNVDYSSEGSYRHEVGHKVERTNRENPEFEKEWKKASNSYYKSIGTKETDPYWYRSKATEKGISGYAGHNRNDLFAESFSAYTHPDYGKEGKKLPEQIDDFMSKWIK